MFVALAQTGEGTSKPNTKQIKRTKNSTKLFSKPMVMYMAQSGENGENGSQEFVTKFYDAQEVHDPTEQVKDLIVGIPRLKFTGQSVDLMNFLKRPRLVKTEVWASTNAIFSELASVNLPSEFTAINAVAQKLNKVAFWAPDLEVEVRINSTRFHYGRLMLTVRRLANFLNDVYLYSDGDSTWPEWYQINANAQQSIKIRVPYKHWMYRLSTFDSDFQFKNFANLSVSVMAPLSCAMQAAVAPVNVLIYVRCIDPHLQGFNYNDFAQAGEDAELSQLVSKGLTTLLPKQILSVATPVLKNMTTIASVAKDVARLGTIAGLSNPVNPAPTNVMQIRQPLFVKANEMNASVNLGPSLTAQVKKDEIELANGSPDEMSIVNIVGHPSLWRVFNITSSMGEGDLLAQGYLSPRFLKLQSSLYTPVANTEQYTPAGYLARMFSYWRGSFKVHFSFITSSFHSCRVRFSWIPAAFSASLVNPTLAQMQDCYSVVMDINESTDYSILIPFESRTRWLSMQRNNGSQPMTYWSNGQFQVRLESRLTSSMATPQPIFCQIFVSMAEDTQFSCPDLRFAAEMGNPAYKPKVVPPAGRSTREVTLERMARDMAADLEEQRTDMDDTIDSWVAQSGEKFMECQLPSSSAACLRDTKYICITGEEHVGERVYGEAMSYEFSSVKEVANLLSPFSAATSAVTEDFFGRKLNPFGRSVFEYDDPAWNCYFMQIRSMFLFGRGSVRFVGLINDAAIQAVSLLDPNLLQEGMWDAANDAPFLGTLGMDRMTPGFQYFMTTQLMPTDITIPYSARSPCMPFLSHPTFSTHYLECASGSITYSVQKTIKKMQFFIAAGDDFQFGCRTGIPRVTHAAT